MLYVMLVGAYPFERASDKKDPAQLQKMIQRILTVAYEIPPHLRLSDDCKGKDEGSGVEGQGSTGWQHGCGGACGQLRMAATGRTASH